MLAILTNNWKSIAAVAAVAAVFLAGWQANGWRHAAKYAKAEREIREQIDERRAELMAEFETQRQIDEAARLRMLDDLDAVRASNEELRADLADALLVKPPEEIIVERVVEVETSGTCQTMAVANPFSGDFVRLFNQSAGIGGGSVP